MTALANTPGSPSKLQRLGFVYMPMGCDITRWTPPGGDTLGELSPTLMPLEPVKSKIAIISNMELKNAYPEPMPLPIHRFSVQASAKRTESTDYYLGTTVDQVAAQQLGATHSCRRLNWRWICCPWSDNATTVMRVYIKTISRGLRRPIRCLQNTSTYRL